MMSYCVLANISASTSDADFTRLLDDLSKRFGPDQGNYFVHRDPPRAIEFSCDDADREVVQAWLQARPDVADVRVDVIDEA